MHPNPVALKLVVYTSGTVRERKKLENQSYKSPREVDNRLYNNFAYF